MLLTCIVRAFVEFDFTDARLPKNSVGIVAF
jgi:hypothetical protein